MENPVSEGSQVAFFEKMLNGGSRIQFGGTVNLLLRSAVMVI